MDKHELTELLNHVADGSISPDDAALKLKIQPSRKSANTQRWIFTVAFVRACPR